MGIQFTAEQVITMAPDASSASAGRKLANLKHWKMLGQSAEALWGECQGSALYQVKVELATLTVQCSCPSRKQPCKHGLGLLLLTAHSPADVPVTEPPDWINAWLAKRAASAKRKETKEQASETGSATPSASQAKTAEKRLGQVKKGIEQLDLWLDDLIRNGLGSLETQGTTFWENQAAQMVNAQAPGLAGRIRQLATLPNASADWPVKLLGQLGQLALLTHAFERIDQLEPALQEDIRQLVGWNFKEDEVLARGERVSDDWLVLGQAVEEIERGRSQRTWFLARNQKRAAMVLQFAFVGSPFAEIYPLGMAQQADLVYWPGLYPQRALIHDRRGDMQPIQGSLPGTESIEAFCAEVATTLARAPWQERFLCTLCSVIPVYEATASRWYVRDRNGHVLPLINGEHWQLLAFSGGHEVDFVGEWNGETLRPLGVLAENTYHIL